MLYGFLKSPKDVHTEHCCLKHGCKYGDVDCVVELGIKKQSFPCEWCYEEAEEAQYRLTSALNSNSTIHKQLIDHLSHLSESEVRDIAQQAGIITPTGQLSKHYG